MVERRRTPCLVGVTAAAFAAEARGMGIVGAMTTFAGARQLRFEVTGTMTLLALEVGVGIQQGKVCFARVIEPRGLPAARLVTVRT